MSRSNEFHSLPVFEFDNSTLYRYNPQSGWGTFREFVAKPNPSLSSTWVTSLGDFKRKVGSDVYDNVLTGIAKSDNLSLTYYGNAYENVNPFEDGITNAYNNGNHYSFVKPGCFPTFGKWWAGTSVTSGSPFAAFYTPGTYYLWFNRKGLYYSTSVSGSKTQLLYNGVSDGFYATPKFIFALIQGAGAGGGSGDGGQAGGAGGFSAVRLEAFDNDTGYYEIRVGQGGGTASSGTLSSITYSYEGEMAGVTASGGYASGSGGGASYNLVHGRTVKTHVKTLKYGIATGSTSECFITGGAGGKTGSTSGGSALTGSSAHYVYGAILNFNASSERFLNANTGAQGTQNVPWGGVWTNGGGGSVLGFGGGVWNNSFMEAGIGAGGCATNGDATYKKGGDGAVLLYY